MVQGVYQVPKSSFGGAFLFSAFLWLSEVRSLGADRGYGSRWQAVLLGFPVPGLSTLAERNLAISMRPFGPFAGSFFESEILTCSLPRGA